MENNIYERDQISLRLTNKIKYLCSNEEKTSLKCILEYLNLLLKKKNILDYEINTIMAEIDKILLYNI